QILSRERGDLKPYFSLGGGTYNTYKGSAGVSGGGENSWFNLSISGIDTEGFNACNGSPTGGGCFTFEPDKDGYRNLSGSFRAGYRFANGAEAEFNWLRSDNDNEFDGSFVNESETVQQVLGGKLRYAPSESWDITVQAGVSEDKSDNFKDGDFQSRFDTERVSASWQNDIFLDDSQFIVAGLDYQDDRVDGTVDYEESSRHNIGGYVQYQGQFNANELQFSLRYDDNEQFGGNTTGSAAWGYQINDPLRFWLSYGTAFKAPTFNELYFPDFGNPDLDPEQSQSIEASLNGSYGWGRWSLNLYYTKIDDLIAFSAATRAPENVDEARITGLEAVYGHQLMGWNFQGALTLLDPKNRSKGANRGNQLPRRAENSFRLDVDRSFDRYSLGATLYAQGSSYDDLANIRRLGGYATFDLRGAYQFAKDWQLEALWANVFDKQYETAAYFNQPGTNVMVTLRYQP
ncbi:MAG: TonB-dependent receptor, partial [Candidatus Competibacteraceae bacterium]|nr:TonB-dependent receptor [Candidatus Competibacteraceae bacterium]